MSDREQRFTFVLVGVAITTFFFLFLQPEFRFTARTYPVSRTEGLKDGRELVLERFEDAPYKRIQQAEAIGLGGGAKIPLGLQRKSLRIVVTGGDGPEKSAV